MDFYRLSRRELQTLSKKNKIPANITNLAMADALTALHTVEGLEDVLITEQTSVDSPAKTEIKQSVPRTSCRTSTRRNPISEVSQCSIQMSTRTRGATRRAPAGEDENAAPVDMVRRKMESQLKEAAEDDKKGAETPAAVAVSRRRVGTSVRQACSTRRSTRLLEKQMPGMNLDDDDDSEQVKGDTSMVKELIKSEESGETDQKMDVEGISQQKKPSDLQEKTNVSDETPASLLEDSLMGDNNEVDSSNTVMQQISEAFDESEDNMDTHAEVLVEDIKDNDESLTKTEKDCEKCGENLENSIYVEHESVTNGVYLDSELTKKESVIAGPIEEGVDDIKEHETASFDQPKIYQEPCKAIDAIVTFAEEEKSMGQNSLPYQSENDESFAMDESVTKSINKCDHEAEESSTIEVTTQIAGIMSTCEMENNDEKTDQLVIVSEIEDETRSTKCDQIADHAEGKDSVFNDKSGTRSPKATEKTHNVPDINKENLVEEKNEKVKMVNADTSLRQLKKMLKQLQISDKNTDIKEEDKIAKVGRARPALQTLSDNCLVTADNKRENGN